jgi:hypothetical protein
MLHNVHISKLENDMNFYEIIMKVHGIFKESGERNVNSIKYSERHKLSFGLYPESWTFFLNFLVEKRSAESACTGRLPPSR